MVRNGKFEVNILTATDSQSEKPSWTVASEYDGHDVNTYIQGSYSKKYISVPKSRDQDGFTIPTAFAVQFRLHGPLSPTFMEGAEHIVFRVLHDDKKIGSGCIKRRDWERGYRYSVRKSYRRHWMEDDDCWVKLNWHLEEGLHGQIRVEVWRQNESQYRTGSWDTPLDMPTLINGNEEYTDYSHPAVRLDFSQPTVHFTKRVDDLPVADFVFEYRSEETLRSIGIIKSPAPVVVGLPRPQLLNLTQEHEPQPPTLSRPSDTHSVYEIPDDSIASAIASPTKTVSSDDFWSNNSMLNSDLSYIACSPAKEKPRFTFPIPLPDDDMPSENFQWLGLGSADFPVTYDEHEFLQQASPPQQSIKAAATVIDLTMEE